MCSSAASNYKGLNAPIGEGSDDVRGRWGARLHPRGWHRRRLWESKLCEKLRRADARCTVDNGPCIGTGTTATLRVRITRKKWEPSFPFLLSSLSLSKKKELLSGENESDLDSARSTREREKRSRVEQSIIAKKSGSLKPFISVEPGASKAPLRWSVFPLPS